MNIESLDPVPTPPSAPPTVPTARPAQATRTGWPTVIGVIAVIFGSFAVLACAFGWLASWRLSASSWLPPEAATQMHDYWEQWRTWSVFFSALTAGTALLLIVAGTKLLKRRASAPTWCRVWAILKMIIVLVSVVQQLSFQDRVFQQVGLTHFTATAGPGAAPIARTAVWFGIALTLFWGLAFPVFLLIWFSLQGIKTETSGWAVNTGADRHGSNR